MLLGYEAGRMCFRPGNGRAEALLLKHALGGHRPPYACDGAIVYRLAAFTADHYFLINDGPAKGVRLEVGNFNCGRVVDAVSGEPIDLAAALQRPLAAVLEITKPRPLS